MTEKEIRSLVLESLASIAPEAETSALDPAQALRDALDIDSMDFLNFVTALHEALQLDIPESDYPRMTTVDACVAYLAERLEGSDATST